MTAVAISAYLILLLAIVSLSRRRSVAEDENKRAVLLAASLLPLQIVAIFRIELAGGTVAGAIWAGCALSLSLVVATGLDPMNAVKWWAGERIEVRQSRRLWSRHESAPKSRKVRAWPVLALFLSATTLLLLLKPDWYGLR